MCFLGWCIYEVPKFLKNLTQGAGGNTVQKQMGSEMQVLSPVLRIGYSKRAVTALQSFSDSSATGLVFVDMSEHAVCGVERRYFSSSKLRLCFSVFLSWCLTLMDTLHLKICPSGTHSSAPSVGCRASVICLMLKSPWCLHSTCQSGGRILSRGRKGKIW